MTPNGESLQVVHRTIVDIQIYEAFDSAYSTTVGMLSELPWAGILKRIHVVVSNPIRILVENAIAEVL